MYLICHVTTRDNFIVNLRVGTPCVMSLLVLCDYVTKFCDPKHCDGRDIMFLIVT